MSVQTFLAQAKAGFESLSISGEHRQNALINLETWLTAPAFAEYVPQIEYWIECEKWAPLLDAFYQVIPFGTGGRRGMVGLGPNRINPWTIQASAQGHSQYLLREGGVDAAKRGVILTFDVRVFSELGAYDSARPNPLVNLSGKDLALKAAEVYTANGIFVQIFNEPRSTPQLSFAIRYLNAAAGDMFSASHNLPSDNGKKVYDEFGGQLIPPFDQKLVDEVTQNVTEILTMPLYEAERQGLLVFLEDTVDAAFHKVILDTSLSNARDIKIVYSPLHGTGLSSVWPVLQQAGFNVHLDPKTANLSGAFENVTFRIPNPEVVQSFDTALAYAKSIDADIILSSDPDADRLGLMVKHNGQYVFVNGNEMGILLTGYAIEKLAQRKKLTPDSLIIKTLVTTSLIQIIANANKVKCIDDLLVGFKYIGAEMNKLRPTNQISSFIMGTEESHGFLTGDYCRDKDAACAALRLAEFAAELKQRGQTLVNALDSLYAMYGYCLNYLTEVRMQGAAGMDKIQHMMDVLRRDDITAFGSFKVIAKTDREDGEPSPHLSETDSAARNVLVFKLENTADTLSLKVTVRPSGTEPKIKMYFEILGHPTGDMSKLAASKSAINAIKTNLEQEVMRHCYGIIGVDFPERGFLLFWQLPLETKLRYFTIEDSLAALRGLPDKNDRRERLDKILGFLGSDAVTKVNDTFKARFGKDLMDYLDLA